MAEKLGEALLDLDTNDKSFKSGIDRSEKLAIGLGRTLDATSARAMALGRNLGLAAAAGVVAFGVLVKRAIDTADEMSKSAARAGMTTEELSRLAWAAELSDVSLGSLTTSMGRLSNVMAEIASGGAKDAKAVFDALGISVTGADGKLRSVGEVMPELADRFAAMENGAAKSALAIQIFGRGGIELIPLLNEGAAGLRDMADEADRLGKTISTQTGQDAERFNDTLTRLQAVVEGLGLKIATALLPDLQSLVGTLSSPGFAAAMQSFGSMVIRIANAIAQVFVGATQAFNDFMGLVDNARQSSSRQAGSLGDNDLQAQIDEAKAIIGNPHSNAFAKERSGAWLKALLAEQRARSTADPILSGAGFADFQSMFSASGDDAGPTFDMEDFDFGALGGGAASAANKVKDLIASLKDELATLRESDPVRQRLLSMREQLTDATVAQRNEVEGLIRTIHAETRAWENAQEVGQFFGDTLLDSLDSLLDGSKSLTEVLDDVAGMLMKAVLQASLLGQGPLAGMMGTQGANGGLGGLLGAIFSGFHAKGGLIPSGKFGIVGERGPEPVIGTARGAMVLPNSSLAGMAGGTEVVINNYAGVKVSAEERPSPGGRRVEVTIDQAVARAIGTPRSASQSALAGAGAVIPR